MEVEEEGEGGGGRGGGRCILFCSVPYMVLAGMQAIALYVLSLQFPHEVLSEVRVHMLVPQLG